MEREELRLAEEKAKQVADEKNEKQKISAAKFLKDQEDAAAD